MQRFLIYLLILFKGLLYANKYIKDSVVENVISLQSGVNKWAISFLLIGVFPCQSVGGYL